MKPSLKTVAACSSIFLAGGFITITVFGTRVSGLIGTYAAVLPVCSLGTLDRGAGVGSFMEIDPNDVVPLDADATQLGNRSSRFAVNQDPVTNDIALLYAAAPDQ